MVEVDGHVGSRFLASTDHFRQTPVENHDFPEISQDHVLAFEISMDHSPRVSIGNRVADGHQGVEHGKEFEGIRPPRVILPSHLAQGAALDESHGIKRLKRVRPAAQFIDGCNSGMFELSSDLRLAQEASTKHGVVGVFGPQFLESDLSTDARGRGRARRDRSLRRHAAESIDIGRSSQHNP